MAKIRHQSRNAASVAVARLKKEYGYSNKHLAAAFDVTPDAVSKWALGRRGVRHTYIAMMRAMLDLPAFVNVVDENHYTPPQSRHLSEERADQLLLKVYHSTHTPKEIRSNVGNYLSKIGMLQPKPMPPTVEQPLNPVIRPEIADEVRDKLFSPQPQAELDDTAIIKRALIDAELMRSKYGLEWYVREDGSLGARRVTVQDF